VSVRTIERDILAPQRPACRSRRSSAAWRSSFEVATGDPDTATSSSPSCSVPTRRLRQTVGVSAARNLDDGDVAAPARSVKAGYDAELADRIREVLSDLAVDGVREQPMFGGLAFLLGGHIAVAASREGGVLLSVDRDDTDALLDRPHTRPMVMRGREMAGWLRVDPDGLRTKRQLTQWVKRGVERARTLPPKKRRVGSGE
jgi:hypothetical protein